MNSLANLPSRDSFLTSSLLGLDRNDKITPTIFLFLTPPNFQELVTSIAFDGYTGIQRTNEMDVCCPNHSFSPKPAKKRADLEQSFRVVDS